MTGGCTAEVLNIRGLASEIMAIKLNKLKIKPTWPALLSQRTGRRSPTVDVDGQSRRLPQVAYDGPVPGAVQVRHIHGAVLPGRAPVERPASGNTQRAQPQTTRYAVCCHRQEPLLSSR